MGLFLSSLSQKSSLKSLFLLRRSSSSLFPSKPGPVRIDRRRGGIARVRDGLQEEARGWGRPLCRLRRARREEREDAREVETAPADFEERPGEAAHHLPQEVRAADAEEDEVGRVGRRLDPSESALYERRVVALGILAEAPEVVPAHEEVRRRLHGGGVEVVLHPVDVPLA